MIIGPFTLIYSINLGKILAFTINSISSAFQSWEIWVAARQSWRFMSWSGRERGETCVFLKFTRVMEEYCSLKASYVTTRTEFVWVVINLRVPCFLILFILELPYIFTSFKFGPLSLGWLCTKSPPFRIKSWMWWLRRMSNALSSKWLPRPS